MTLFPGLPAVISKFTLYSITLIYIAHTLLTSVSMAGNPCTEFRYRVALDSVRGKVVDACVHVRTPALHWRLVWNYKDSANYSYSAVRKLWSGVDNLTGYTSRVVVGKIQDGANTFILKKDVNHDNAEFSLYLRHDQYATELSVANGDLVVDLDGDEDFDIEAGKPVFAESEKPFDIEKSIFKSSITYTPNVIRSRFTGIDSLLYYLSQSKDKNERMITYLDRDFASGATMLGGRYTMAMVRADGEDIVHDSCKKHKGNVYLMLYIDGAETHAHLWQPLDVKAIMYPTAFSNSYDLIWICPDRNAAGVEYEANALIDNNMVTISFPTMNSTVRFSSISRDYSLESWHP